MHPSAIPSELTNSGLRAPQPSPIRAPPRTPRHPRPTRGRLANSNSNHDNSSDDDSDSDFDDDDDDDVRLTRSPSRATAEEISGPGPAPSPGPAPPPPKPKTDNAIVPSIPAAAAGAAPGRFSLALTLRNTGSVARDHLASERTFLAYVRTSLSFASAGVALVQLFRVSVSSSSSTGTSPAVASYARPLGATLIAFGLAVLGMGTHRYFSVQRSLPQGFFPAARLSVFLQAVSLGTLVGIVFGILVAVR